MEPDRPNNLEVSDNYNEIAGYERAVARKGIIARDRILLILIPYEDIPFRHLHQLIYN